MEGQETGEDQDGCVCESDQCAGVGDDKAEGVYIGSARRWSGWLHTALEQR